MTGGRAITGVVALAAVALAGCTSPPGASTHSAASAMSSAPSPKPPPKPAPTALSTAEVASMVRTLYNGESQAYQIGLKDGFDYNLAHDYPGSENKWKFLACAAKTEAQSQGETASFVPEIGTLAPDPTWVGPSDSSQADWVFAGKKPRGQTYIVTVDSTYTSASGQQNTSKNQLHVTIWNGTAYFYLPACPS
jgi:hypothetical protein